MKLILAFILTLSSFSSFSQNDADPIVAEVEGKTIRKSTLLAYHKQNLNVVSSGRTVTLEKSLNDLIDRIIGIENAKKINVHKRADVVKKMNDIVYHAHISDELTPKLKKITKATDKDIAKYYNQFPEYKTSQILLRIRTIPNDQEVADTMQLANKIYDDAIKNPKKFSELAKKYGQTTTALTGGDMGYQPKVRLAPEYYSAIKGKRSGYITNPFRTQYGIHIVMVTGEKKLDQIDKGLYEKILYDQKRDEILKTYFSEKRKQAKIKINKEKL